MPDDGAPITCHHCGWAGIFSDLSLEAFQDRAHYSCPDCETHLVLVSHAAAGRGSGTGDAAPKRITGGPNARGTVRMTRVEGGADMTPDEKRRAAREIAKRLARGSPRSEDGEST